jgi:primosomal protein N''
MAKKGNDSDQVRLMKQIRDSLPGNISLVDELADLLKLSNDSAYRRMRGETQLSIEEISMICKHFKISFDAFLNTSDSNTVSFSYHKLSGRQNSFQDYLNNISTDLERILQFDKDNRQIIFAAEDIPVFHHFSFPLLTAFKIFYWNKSILNERTFDDNKFDPTLIPQELADLAKEVYEQYSRISSIEIWSDDTANSTIKQIEFYWDSGIFSSREQALQVCAEVSQMLERIRKQAETNSKHPEHLDNYQLYHSDVMIGNNSILVTAGPAKAAYISYNTFNSMVTRNAEFCNETELWLKNLIRKSNLISGVAEKQRYRYFRRIENSLESLRQKISNE